MRKKLTIKENKFADSYIEQGNATEAYLGAYAKQSRASAEANARKLLAKPHIKAYIEERMAMIESKSIAKQEEVLQYLTSVMRGELTEEVLKGVGGGEQVITNMDITARDRIKAAELIGKRYGLFTEKLEVDSAGLVVITDDISAVKSNPKN